MKIAIVHGYGLYSPERKDYEAYLNYIAEEIEKEKFDKVILCGGFTVPDRCDESEAGTMKAYLQTKIDFDQFVLEDRSINTNQNLEFAAEFVHKQSANTIVVYGDITRKPKIIWIALHFITNLDLKSIYKQLNNFAHKNDPYMDFSFGNLTVKGFDFDRTKKEDLQGVYGNVLDVMALYDREMNNMDVERRKKEFGLK